MDKFKPDALTLVLAELQKISALLASIDAKLGKSQ